MINSDESLIRLVFLPIGIYLQSGRNQYQIGLKLSHNSPLFLKTGLVDISGEVVYNNFRKKGAYTKLGRASLILILSSISTLCLIWL